MRTIFHARYAFAALKENGSVITWGYSNYGGNSSRVSKYLSTGVKEIFSTDYAFAALKENGSVVTWGYGDYGGDRSVVSRDLVGNVKKIFSTHRAFAALKNNGSVVVWGQDSYGGDSGSVATDLIGEVRDIVSTNYAFAAIKDDDSVLSWGRSKYGGDSSAVSEHLEGIIKGVSWTPNLSGTVGMPLVLDEVVGAEIGDVVSYIFVSGSCSLDVRTLTFSDVGTCVVKATVGRSGYSDWDSGEKIIVVSPGTLSGISWTPTLIGTVGVRLVLEEVVGVLPGDKVTYTRVRGSCRLNKREVTFTDGGECVVKATLARSGYLNWDSGEKIINISRGVPTGVSWAPSLIGTVGVRLVLEEVVGVLPGDKVTYTRVRGSCRLNKREVTFTDGGECVVKATLARSGYLDWDSGEKIIAVGLGTLSGISWAPSLIGTVGVPLVLEEVVGVLPGDKVTYTRVRGSCRLNKREVTFTDGGECVVKATLARSGYLDWDSGEKIIAVGLGTLSGISWAPSLIGTVGVRLVLEEVVGVLPGDKVTYTRVRGSCRLNKREVTFTDGGECVVKATLARSGYLDWDSGEKKPLRASVALTTHSPPSVKVTSLLFKRQLPLTRV